MEAEIGAVDVRDLLTDLDEQEIPARRYQDDESLPEEPAKKKRLPSSSRKGSIFLLYFFYFALLAAVFLSLIFLPVTVLLSPSMRLALAPSLALFCTFGAYLCSTFP